MLTVSLVSTRWLNVLPRMRTDLCAIEAQLASHTKHNNFKHASHETHKSNGGETFFYSKRDNYINIQCIAVHKNDVFELVTTRISSSSLSD